MLAHHGTLTPDVVSTVELDARVRQVEIVNRSLSGALWVRLDGANPQIAGEDSYVVLGARSFTLRESEEETVVKLISDDALDFSVEGTYQ